MPSMMKNQPMKDSYVGGLEESLAKKMKPYPPKMRPVKPRPQGRDKILKNGRPMFGKFGM